MASQYITVKKYTGVCYSESKQNKFRGRPDKIYWVRFRDKHGKLRYERCGRASEGWTPEAAQQKRYQLLEQERTGTYKPKQQRNKESIALNQLFDDHYLPWAEVNKKSLIDDTSRYNTWIRKDLGNKLITEISPTDIESIRSNMLRAGRANATVRQVYSLIRHIFNKATDWELWNSKNPCASIKMPKLNNARERFLSKEEAETLLSELRKTSIQVAQIAALSLYSGMRRGEIFSLKWKDIDSDHKMITILDSKSGESRKIFITEPLKEVLNELATDGPGSFLFTNNKGDLLKSLSKTFPRTVKKLGLNAGIDDNRQKITFHSLRHSFASWAVMNGTPLFHLAKALGHKTTAMTERYSHLAPDSQRLAFEKVAEFSNSNDNG